MIARLRQRHVVTPCGERGRGAPERTGDDEKRPAEREGGSPDVQRDRPRRAVGPGDDAADGDGREHEDERSSSRREQLRIRQPGKEHVGREERERQRGESPVGRAELEGRARDDERRAERAGSSREAEDRARCCVR